MTEDLFIRVTWSPQDLKNFFQHSRMKIVVIDDEMVPDGTKHTKLFDFRDPKRLSNSLLINFKFVTQN